MQFGYTILYVEDVPATLAFYGESFMPNDALIALIISQWIFKVCYETAATPLTYLVVNYLKRHEGVDFYDRDTKFTPFALTEYSPLNSGYWNILILSLSSARIT